MLRPQGPPTDADCVTATPSTRAANWPSFVQIGQKLAKPGHHYRSYYDTTSAIVTLRGPQKTSRVETYVESWYKNNTVPKTTIKESKTFKKWIPDYLLDHLLDHHHHHQTHHHWTPTMVPPPLPHQLQLQQQHLRPMLSPHPLQPLLN